MEVGDLVRDVVQDDIGIIITVGTELPRLYKVSFAKEDLWLADTFLEVIK